jgi:hypothetical protein
MSILQDYINPLYLDPTYLNTLRESVKSKPISKYLVLDNFFKEEVLERIVTEHHQLDFNEKIDRTGAGGQLLAYDGALAGCSPGSLLGRLLYSQEWQQFLLNLMGLSETTRRVEIKLRQHRKDADGFWLHTDSGGGGREGWARDLVAITYYNKDWKAEDGGLLQLWRVDEANLPDTPLYTHEDGLKGPMNFLNQPRIKARPAGVFPFDGPRDFVLVEQVLPVYNRIFLCNFKEEPAYHSVTPSNGKIREGFVQWLLEAQD